MTNTVSIILLAGLTLTLIGVITPISYFIVKKIELTLSSSNLKFNIVDIMSISKAISFKSFYDDGS